MEETKKSKINFIIYIIVCVVVAISSFFMGYQYGKNPQTINSQISSSFAVGDTTTGTFISSNFYVPMQKCINGDLDGYYGFDYDYDTYLVDMRFSLTYNSADNNYLFGLMSKYFYSGSSGYNSFSYIYWGLNNVSITGNTAPFYTKILDNSNGDYYLKTYNESGKAGWLFKVYVESGFDTLNVMGVTISKQTSVESFVDYTLYVEDDEIDHNLGLIEFDYFDINGKRFRI